jgi:shikimate kinase
MRKIKRIHIVGIYGSGKSMLAEKLAKMLKIKAYDLDEIKYKRKYDVIRPVEERLKIVKKISNLKSWITEGAWTSYAIDLYKKADLVILLEIPESTLYKRILLRHFKRKFSEKTYKEHNIWTTLKIMKKVRQYYHDPEHFMTLESHRAHLSKYAKEAFVIKNDDDIERLLEAIA